VTELLVPYERGDILASIHREGEVMSVVNEDAGIRVKALLGSASAGRLDEFVVVPDRGAA
jgi:GTP-binding protein HflX